VQRRRLTGLVADGRDEFWRRIEEAKHKRVFGVRSMRARRSGAPTCRERLTLWCCRCWRKLPRKAGGGDRRT